MFSLGSGSAPPALSEKDLRNLVNTELIREAGVDYESRPLLVFYSCHLPDPRAADYDFLLDSILTRLDQFVERDYAIVLFSSGSKHQPSWAWMFKAYSRLSRKFRKNLKNLYIVHPSPWAKLLLQMMGTIISPKFTRKVVWVNSLSLLKTHIPLGNIYIPDIIIQANERFEHSSSAPSSPPPPLKINTNPDKKVPGVMFGVDLKVLMGADGSKGIPIVISDTVAYIRANGLDCEGVFRRSPSSQLLKDAKDYYDRGEKGFDFEERGGLHCATVLLKLFFRELPKPIFESDMTW
ncbi:divergent CRAL/TRIO domain-containing protein [Chytridium lagenaria]|nr:divergent CRAL/TRIO domain-containing protein [Chytridium lagenaria]